MITVTILRGDFLLPLVYQHKDLRSARRRADATCEMHSARMVEAGDSSSITVDCGEYYGTFTHEFSRLAALQAEYPAVDFVLTKRTKPSSEYGRIKLRIERRERLPSNLSLVNAIHDGVFVEVIDGPCSSLIVPNGGF